MVQDEDMPEAQESPSQQSSTRVRNAVLEIEQHVAEGGWDQSARLFALVPNRDIIDSDPDLAAKLGVTDPDGLTSVEQELPNAQLDLELDTALAKLAWPSDVVGCALVLERLLLPPDAEAELPPDESGLAAAASAHPLKEEVRIAVAVTREGARHCAIRLRKQDDEHSVLTGEDLVPRLAEALHATFAD